MYKCWFYLYNTQKANKVVKLWLTFNIKGVKTSTGLSGSDSHIDSEDDDDSRDGQMLRWVEQNSKLVKKREGWEMGVNMPPHTLSLFLFLSLALLPFIMSSCRVGLSSLFCDILPSDHSRAPLDLCRVYTTSSKVCVVWTTSTTRLIRRKLQLCIIFDLHK